MRIWRNSAHTLSCERNRQLLEDNDLQASHMLNKLFLHTATANIVQKVVIQPDAA